MSSSNTRIPEDKLPQCWSDDVRMNALFAPFRLKTANPESWDMKMKFWSDMLKQWCRHKRDPIISAADAKLAFQRKGRTPACLEIVVEECVRNSELSPISKYLQILHNGPEGWVKWGAKLAFKPAVLAITAVSYLMPNKQLLDNDGLPKASIDITQGYVVESVVQEQASKLLEDYPSSSERVGTIDDLMTNCGWSSSRETFEVLLGWLVNQNKAIKCGDVVKLAPTPSTKPSPITQTDEALVKLLAAERRLEDDAEKMTRDVELAAGDAKAALQIGNRVAAKNHLRRKHKIQDRLNKCDNALENIRQLLHSMRDIEVNAAVVDTYKIGTNAMKNNMKENNMSEDTVHDTMDDLKDVLETYNEIEKTLSAPTDEFDIEELEQELKDILSGSGGVGGTPTKATAPQKQRPSKEKSNRKVSERDFIFDCEDQMMAQLNELGVEDSSPGAARVEKREKVAVSETWKEDKKVSEPKESKTWYPAEDEFALDESLNNLGDSFAELCIDERIHPGQKLSLDMRKPTNMYNTDFQVRDHKNEDGVWFYNSKDYNQNADFATSTEYFSHESPGKSSSSFLMAPGSERRTSQKSDTESDMDDLQSRLNNLRGF